MEQSEFERNIRLKMEGLEENPGEELWDRIERRLPPHGRRRPFLFWILPLAMIAAVLIWILVGNKKDRTQQADLAPSTAQSTQPVAETHGSAHAEKAFAEDRLQVEDQPGKSLPGERNIDPETNSVSNFQENFRDKSRKVSTNLTPQQMIKTREKQIIIRGNNSSEPVTTSTASTKEVEGMGKKDEQGTRTTQNQSDDEKQHSEISDSLENKTIETAFQIAPTDSTEKSTIPDKKKERKKQWQIGMVFSAGRSGVGDGILNRNTNPATFDPVFSGGGGTGGVAVSYPHQPETGLYLNGSFYLDKKIDPRMTFSTGFGYTVYQNKILTGLRVDSAATYSFGTGQISANNYYLVGEIQAYRNNYHYLTIPVSIRYQPIKKFPVELLGGASFNLLLQSNALVYSANEQKYFSNKVLYSRATAGFHTGVEARICTAFQFSI